MNFTIPKERPPAPKYLKTPVYSEQCCHWTPGRWEGMTEKEFKEHVKIKEPDPVCARCHNYVAEAWIGPGFIEKARR